MCHNIAVCCIINIIINIWKMLLGMFALTLTILLSINMEHRANNKHCSKWAIKPAHGMKHYKFLVVSVGQAREWRPTDYHTASTIKVHSQANKMNHSCNICSLDNAPTSSVSREGGRDNPDSNLGGITRYSRRVLEDFPRADAGQIAWSSPFKFWSSHHSWLSYNLFQNFMDFEIKTAVK